MDPTNIWSDACNIFKNEFLSWLQTPWRNTKAKAHLFVAQVTFNSGNLLTGKYIHAGNFYTQKFILYLFIGTKKLIKSPSLHVGLKFAYLLLVVFTCSKMCFSKDYYIYANKQFVYVVWNLYTVTKSTVTKLMQLLVFILTLIKLKWILILYTMFATWTICYHTLFENNFRFVFQLILYKFQFLAWLIDIKLNSMLIIYYLQYTV